MSSPHSHLNPSDMPEPAWEVAHLFPAQGTWSELEYLALPGNRLIEFIDGSIEILAHPITSHQEILSALHRALDGFLQSTPLGTAIFAPLPVKLWEGRIRTPDLMFMLKENAARRRNEYWEGADLVMEVVSDDDRRRDLEIKRFEYARAGIPEYWIVDPHLSRITVLTLDGQRYAVHGEFAAGQKATSRLLASFVVDVSETFDAGQGPK